jgi:hypothetical protein
MKPCARAVEPGVISGRDFIRDAAGDRRHGCRRRVDGGARRPGLRQLHQPAGLGVCAGHQRRDGGCQGGLPGHGHHRAGGPHQGPSARAARIGLLPAERRSGGAVHRRPPGAARHGPRRRLPVHSRQRAACGGQPRQRAAVFIGVRNEPTAQESVVMLPELDGLVPTNVVAYWNDIANKTVLATSAVLNHHARRAAPDVLLRPGQRARGHLRRRGGHRGPLQALCGETQVAGRGRLDRSRRQRRRLRRAEGAVSEPQRGVPGRL